MKNPKDPSNPQPESPSGEKPTSPDETLRDQNLSAFLFGELGEMTESDIRELEKELESSEERREELELLRRTVEAVKAAAPRLEALEPERRRALLEAARRERTAARSGSRAWYWLAGLAAAAALTIAAWPLVMRVGRDGIFGEREGERLAMDAGPNVTGVADELKELPATSPAGAPETAALEVRLADRSSLAAPEGASAAPEAGETLRRIVESEPVTWEETGAKPSERGRYSYRSAVPGSSTARKSFEELEARVTMAETEVPLRANLRSVTTPQPSGSRPEARFRAPDVRLRTAPTERATRLYYEARGSESKKDLQKLDGGDLLVARSDAAARPTPAPAKAPARGFTLQESFQDGVEKPALEPAGTGAAEGTAAGRVAERASTEKDRYGASAEAKPRAEVERRRAGEAGSGELLARARREHVAHAAVDGDRPDAAGAAEPDRELSELQVADRAKEAEAAEAEHEKAAEGDEAASEGRGEPQRTPFDPRVAVDNILSRLDRRPGETPDMMFFRYWGDNPFVEASADELSTFGVDVDTASYTLMRSYIYKRGVLPPKEAIRTEEFVNYFKTGYEPPPEGKTFAVHTEIAPSPFAHEPGYQLLKIGIKAKEVRREERKPCSLVFVIDTSGSMRRENRLELVKEALRLLVPELDEGDTIGIAAFDREARKILDPTPASERERILDAIGTLYPRRNTNVDAGLQLGYRLAADHLLAGGNNRVILLSDGVANTGVTDVNRIVERVKEEREKGIYLTSVGVGMGNLNDALLEQLADKGDGQCVYVDRIEEARKIFVEQITGTLEAVARNVKIQVAFHPEEVIRYRLLGYENRAIADSLFRDNKVDAGEVGAGHEVVALYELKSRPRSDSEDAGAQETRHGKLATVRVRYLTVEHNEAIELEHDVLASSARGEFAGASPRFQLSALVAESAEILRDSYWARGSSLDRVASMAQELLGPGEGKLGEDEDVVEFVALMKKADSLVRVRIAQTDEQDRLVDAIKENRWLRARLSQAADTRREEDLRHLEDLRRQNEDLRRRFEELLDSRAR